MIKIKRVPCPNQLLTAKGQNSYRARTIVSTLWKMQNEKCCYCEQYVAEAGHSRAVEHFRPKSGWPDLRNSWANLLLACSQCNGSKSDKFPVRHSDCTREYGVVDTRTNDGGGAAILDPSCSSDDPENHLDYVVDFEESTCGLVFAKGDDEMGKCTIETIDLCSAYYVKMRRERVFELQKMYLDLLRVSDPAQPNVSSQKNQLSCLLDRISPKSDFSAVGRTFFRKKEIKKKFQGVLQQLETD